MRYRLPYLVLFSAVLCASGCAKSQLEIPDWAVGTWEGMLSWEHDLPEYHIRLALDGLAENTRIEYLSLGCSMEVGVASVSERMVKLLETEGEADSQCGPFGSGVIVLGQVDSFDPSWLHMEYHPADKEELWLAQVEKK